ncbi:TPA: hypothetical protein HA241_07495, partial [Candidatus Woesearchaeota archaeon]|nr:hypothetical protein [Candidatus Woesearchaeota archaeon]
MSITLYEGKCDYCNGRVSPRNNAVYFNGLLTALQDGRYPNEFIAKGALLDHLGYHGLYRHLMPTADCHGSRSRQSVLQPKFDSLP